MNYLNISLIGLDSIELSQDNDTDHISRNALASLVSFRKSRSGKHLYSGVLLTETHAITATSNIYKLSGPNYGFIQVWAGIVFGKNGGTSRRIAEIDFDKNFCNIKTAKQITKIAVVTVSESTENIKLLT